MLHCVPLGGDHCDFCDTHPVVKLYTCKNFEWDGLPVFSVGPDGLWAACRRCSELVDAKRWSTLTERALRAFLQKHPTSNYEEPQLWAQFTAINRLFAEHVIDG
jgi:hypothetical protein